VKGSFTVEEVRHRCTWSHQAPERARPPAEAAREGGEARAAEAGKGGASGPRGWGGSGHRRHHPRPAAPAGVV